MIESITLRYFQIHEYFHTKLDRTNTFVGPSDAGKSTVLRALLWLSTNRPSGSAFVGRFGKAAHTTVSGQVDGRVVGRRRGRSVNLYRLDDQRFSAFGTGVPAAIADLLNVGEENFQGQHDAPFLLSLSPPEVARQLNSIINLGLIDRTLTNASKAVHRAKVTISITEERLLNARTRKKELAWAVACHRDVTDAQGVADRLAAARQDADSLRQAASDLSRRVSVARRLSVALEAGSTALQAISAYSVKREQADSLRILGKAVRIAEAKAQAKPPGVGKLNQAWEAYEQARLRQRELNKLVLGMAQHQHEIDFADTQLYGLNEQLKKITGGLCPSCGRPLPS